VNTLANQGSEERSYEGSYFRPPLLESRRLTEFLINGKLNSVFGGIVLVEGTLKALGKIETLGKLIKLAWRNGILTAEIGMVLKTEEINLKVSKVGVLLESDFYENEIHYYQHRFAEEELELHFLTRLWGNDAITFKGHEYHEPMECRGSPVTAGPSGTVYGLLSLPNRRSERMLRFI